VGVIMDGHHLQQSPDPVTALLARPQSWDEALASWSLIDFSTTSPKSRASASHVAARSRSLDERPLGLCVVQRMKVVLKT